MVSKRMKDVPDADVPPVTQSDGHRKDDRADQEDRNSGEIDRNCNPEWQGFLLRSIQHLDRCFKEKQHYQCIQTNKHVVKNSLPIKLTPENEKDKRKEARKGRKRPTPQPVIREI